MPELDDTTSRLLEHLGRGGQWQYYWVAPNQGKKITTWWPVGQPAEIPALIGNIYFGVHPGRARKERWQRNELGDVAAINCLFAEFDAKDFDGGKPAVLEHIEGLRVAPSVIIDSGGGYHCYWLLYEPFVIDDEASFERAKRLQATWVAFTGSDDGAKDLARVLRLPGTHNVKPEYAPNFPVVTIISADFDAVYSLAVLEAHATPKPAPKPYVTYPSSNGNGNGNGAYEKYGRAALSGELARLASTAPGARNAQLNRSAFQLGTLVGAGVLDAGEVENALISVARQIGLGERETIATIKSGLGDGKDKPRQLPEKKPQSTRSHSTSEESSTEPAPAATPAETREETGADLALVGFDPDDAGNARAFMSVYGRDYVYVEAYGWLRWNGHYWQLDGGEAELVEDITDLLTRRRMAAVKLENEKVVAASKPNIGRVNGCRELLQAFLYESIDRFDSNPDQLNCANGVVNLRSGELVPHDRSQRFTYCIQVPYDPNADMSRWLAFLAAAVGGGQSVIDWLQEAVGYTLTGHTYEECLFYLYGPTRSGKGTFTETLLDVTGKPLSTEVDFNTFTQRRDGDSSNFDLAPLKPCRLIVASESSRYQSLNAAKVKALTGGNWVYCSFKHKNHFSYRPAYKIWLASNWPVNGDADDSALWTRVRVVEFPNSHEEEEDKLFKASMKAPETLTGVLRWAVEGALRWYAKGGKGLSTPSEVKKSTRGHRDQADYVQQWLDECCEANPNDTNLKTTNQKLYLSYENWCKGSGVEPKKLTGLTQTLKAKGFKIGIVERTSIDKIERFVGGIRVL